MSRLMVNKDWTPLGRALIGALLGGSIGFSLSRGQWVVAVVNVLALAAMWAPRVIDDLKHSRGRLKCGMCGKRATELYSMIPPPKVPRLMPKAILRTWTIWAACDEHDEDARRLLLGMFDSSHHVHATTCDEDHEPPRLYGIPASYRG